MYCILNVFSSFAYATANNIELHWHAMDHFNALESIVLMQMAPVYIFFGAITAAISSRVMFRDIAAMDLHMYM